MSFNRRRVFARDISTRIGLSAAIALAVSSGAAMSFAEEVHELDQVVVTASRTAQTVDETLAPVTVITREEIERKQATSVTELLSQVPGVQIASNGGPGSKSGVFIRGTSTAQTLILMDGIKINSGADGASPLEYLDPDQIERIEIVRGPRSAIYGADAIGGVINFITRKGTGSPKLAVKVGAGSRETGEYGLNFGGESEGTQFNFGTRLYETKGYDRTIKEQGADADDDAFRNKSVSASLTKHFENDLSAGINASHTEGNVEYDGGKYPTSFFEVSNVNAFVSGDVNKYWGSRLEVGFQRNHRDDIGGAFGDSTATSKRYSTAWINDVAWAENQYLISGIDYSIDEVESNYNYKEKDRYNLGVFAQNTSSFGANEIQVSGRYDKNEAYGEEMTGSASWALDLPHDMRLITTYGTSFRMPSFMDLNSNPDLKPESAKNAEIELRGRAGANTSWAINVYRNDISDMFLWNGRFMENTDALIKGVELSGSTLVLGWVVSGNVSLLDPEFSSGLNKGNELNRRAKQLFAFNADREFGRWTLGGTLRGQGEAWDSPDNKSNHLSGFGTLDLRMSVKLTAELKTQFKVVNLMDKEYATADGYIDEPNGVFATLVWTPEM